MNGAALKIDPAYAQASADFAEAKLDGLGTEADRLALRTNAYNLGSSPGAVPGNAAGYSARRRRRNCRHPGDVGRAAAQYLPRERSLDGRFSRQVVHQPLRTVSANSGGRPSCSI